jgi:hypothetical protein
MIDLPPVLHRCEDGKLECHFCLERPPEVGDMIPDEMRSLTHLLAVAREPGQAAGSALL